MKYAVLLLAVLLAACAPAAGQPLTQATVFETGPFDCDRQTLTWTWEASQDTYIRQAESWQGMDMGAVADFSVILARRSDGAMLFRHNWDHYADPTGVGDSIVQRQLAPDSFLVRAGDALILSSTCLPYPGPTHGHIIIDIWYTEAQ